VVIYFVPELSEFLKFLLAHYALSSELFGRFLESNIFLKCDNGQRSKAVDRK